MNLLFIKKFKNISLFLIFFSNLSVFGKPRFTSPSSTLLLIKPTSMLVIHDPMPTFDGTLVLEKDGLGRIIAQTVIFDNAEVQTLEGTKFIYTGTFVFDWFNNMFVSDGSLLNLRSGSMDRMVVVNPNATVKMIGSPEFFYDVKLTDSTSTLRLGLQNKFNKNLILNGGKIILDDDLKFRDGCRVLEGGIIDVNGRTLHLPGDCFATGPITYINANGISIEKDIRICSNHSFIGENQSSEIIGNGFSWSFFEEINNGQITVGPKHKLHMINMKICGIGLSQNYSSFDIDPTSTIVFKNCTLSFNGNYTHSKGTIQFDDGCRIIHNDYAINTVGNASILVDGVSLIYDSLSSADTNPFTFTNIDSQRLTPNFGAIKSSVAYPCLMLTGQNLIFNSDHKLSMNSRMNFLLETRTIPDEPKEVIVDFNGHALIFPKVTNALINIAPNTKVTMKNTELYLYDQDSVSYGDQNSELIFGAGTKITLSEPDEITAQNRPWRFVGDGVISGPNTKLVLNGSKRITVEGSSTLTLKNLIINVKNIDSLAILDEQSKIIFEECDLFISSDQFEIDCGNIEIKGTFRLFNGDTSNHQNNAKLIFSSSGLFRVLSRSLFRIGKHMEFEYKANPVFDGGSVHASKRHFYLKDSTSVLELDGCTLHSTMTGLAIDHGQIIVNDQSTFLIDGFDGTEAEFGSALDVYIKPAVTLSITGTLAYNQTSLPSQNLLFY